jgi:hypothetical protein
MPGGATQACVSSSLSHAEVRSPRLALTAVCTGVRTWSATNTTPTTASGSASESPPCTAPTSAPMAMANTAGSAPRATSTPHQA